MIHYIYDENIMASKGWFKACSRDILLERLIEGGGGGAGESYERKNSVDKWIIFLIV